MSVAVPKPARARLVEKIRLGFLALGYERLTMKDLAEFCGLTRRALYHHFSSKDDAFRAVIQQTGQGDIEAATEAAKTAIAKREQPANVVATLFDVRYGVRRRELAASQYAQEINDTAFRLCRPIMIAQATELHARLADLLNEMQQRGMLKIKPSVASKRLAALLADGARGVNQTLPPIPIAQLVLRYREMAVAILYGCAEPPAAKKTKRSSSKAGK